MIDGATAAPAEWGVCERCAHPGLVVPLAHEWLCEPCAKGRILADLDDHRARRRRTR